MPVNPNTYFGPALTDTQNELTAKVGSMKSILALPDIRKPNIPKDKQISAFDYLLKIFNTLGVDPAIIFNSFLSLVFDEAGTFLEEKVLLAIADSMGEKGVRLNPYLNNPTATAADKKNYKSLNRIYLTNLIPNSFLQAVKQKIAKDLMIMVFGKSTSLNSNQTETQTLLDNAVCGMDMFSISNDPESKDSDIEYNRIKKRQELENGQVVFEISCQNIKISLPQDASVFFTGGGLNTVNQTLPPTPYQSLTLVNQYVGNEFQKINNERNSNKGGKSFLHILIEYLITYISTLVQPYLTNVFTTINNSVNPTVPFNVNDYYFSNCAINNMNGNSDAVKKQKKEFTRSLLNALLKDLIKLMLTYGIKYFKKFVKNYFAKKALERQKRKAEKSRLKFQQITSKVKDTADKIEKYQAALSVLTNILENNVV